MFYTYSTSAFIHATGRVRRGKVLQYAVGQGAPWDRGLAQCCARAIATAFLVNASVRDGCRWDLRYCLFSYELTLRLQPVRN